MQGKINTRSGKKVYQPEQITDNLEQVVSIDFVHR